VSEQQESVPDYEEEPAKFEPADPERTRERDTEEDSPTERQGDS
jgi:hypothetical protein